MEDIAPYELAIKLKEKGFNIPFYFYYRTDDKFLHHANVTNPLVYCDEIDDEVVIAPTIPQVLRWVRENNKLHISTKPYPCEDGVMWQYEIRSFSPALVCVIVNKTGFQKPEQADLAGIEHVIDNNLI